SMEDFYPNKNHGPDSGIGSDNGDKRLSTTEPSDDDTISLHSQVSESTREQTIRNDNHVTGSKLDPQKDQEAYDYIDPNTEEGALPEQGDAQIGPLLSYVKERGKHSEKSQKIEQNEDWGDEKRLQKEQLLAEDDDELKEVTDLRKIAAQLLQQEQKHRLLNHSVSVNTRNRPKQPVESEKCVSTNEVNSSVSPYSWQPLENQKDSMDEQHWPETQPVIWQNEERRRSKQIRKEYFKYKSSRKSSSGNENDEQDSDNTNVSPQSPVSSEVQVCGFVFHSTNISLSFSRASRQDYGAVDPGFTMRRKMEHLREEREQIRQLREVGTIIYHVGAVHLVCSVSRWMCLLHPFVPKTLTCQMYCVILQERLCLPHHILEERGLVKVGLTVQALLELPAL
ncbi:LRCH2 protein, partial [Calyptomena viridis]|nr:LRCH2 protein [Calyptomena viridis]